ncbi:MAG: hypothetical protein JWL77_7052 [Chthonomonadaceae bacterium]|nr:hypothetical protein [Chthonomonadaceae bacterium]
MRQPGDLWLNRYAVTFGALSGAASAAVYSVILTVVLSFADISGDDSFEVAAFVVLATALTYSVPVGVIAGGLIGLLLVPLTSRQPPMLWPTVLAAVVAAIFVALSQTFTGSASLATLVLFGLAPGGVAAVGLLRHAAALANHRQAVAE